MDLKTSVENSLNSFKDLIGAAEYDRIIARARKQAAKRPSDQKHNRIFEVILNLSNYVAFGSDIPIVDAVEMDVLCSSLKRWRESGRLPSILQVLLNHPTNYYHTRSTICLIEHFKGCTIDLLEENGQEPRPDLVISTQDKNKFFVEVWAPLDLQLPGASVTSEIAIQKISSLKTTTHLQKGQISQKYPGIVAVCGFSLGDECVEYLLHAVENFLIKKGERRTHLLGIIVSDLRVEIDHVEVDPNGQLRVPAFGTSCRGHNVVQFVGNPHVSSTPSIP